MELRPAPQEIEDAIGWYSERYRYTRCIRIPTIGQSLDHLNLRVLANKMLAKEEPRQNVEELVEQTVHDYADPDLSEDEKESIKQAKGKNKKTLEQKGTRGHWSQESKTLKTFWIQACVRSAEIAAGHDSIFLPYSR